MLAETVRPQLHFEFGYLNLLIALIGTTISPYMQLYVQSSVVEKGVTPDEYRYTRFDVIVGTISAGIVAVFIIIATAATLYPRGITVDHRGRRGAGAGAGGRGDTPRRCSAWGCWEPRCWRPGCCRWPRPT